MLDLAIITAKGRPLSTIAQEFFGSANSLHRLLRNPFRNWCCCLVKLLRVDIHQRGTVMFDGLFQYIGQVLGVFDCP